MDRLIEKWQTHRPWSARLDRYGRTVLRFGPHGKPSWLVVTADPDMLGGDIIIAGWRFTWDGATEGKPRRRRRSRKEEVDA